MVPALQALLIDMVMHAPYTGQDAYGKPTYGTPVSLACRIEYKVQPVTNIQGEERVSTTRIFFDGDVAIHSRDRITLPDGTAPAIQQLSSMTWPTSGEIDHYMCLL